MYNNHIGCLIIVWPYRYALFDVKLTVYVLMSTFPNQKNQTEAKIPPFLDFLPPILYILIF